MSTRALSKTLTAVCVVTATLSAATAAHAVDSCRLYRDSGRQGPTYQVNLSSPEGTNSENAWASTSNRRTGANLSGGAQGSAVVYDEASSIRIRAFDSEVRLMAFTGDNFDGRVRVYRCAEGNTCVWNQLGFMDDDMSSFICQRELRGEPGSLQTRPSPLGLGNGSEGMEEWIADNEEIEVASSWTQSWIWQTAMTWCGLYPDDLEVWCSQSWRKKYEDIYIARWEFQVGSRNLGDFFLGVDVRVTPTIEQTQVGFLDAPLLTFVPGSRHLTFDTDEAIWPQRVLLMNRVLNPYFDGDANDGKDFTTWIHEETLRAQSEDRIRAILGETVWSGLSYAYQQLWIDGQMVVDWGNLERVQMFYGCTNAWQSSSLDSEYWSHAPLYFDTSLESNFCGGGNDAWDMNPALRVSANR